MLIITGPGRSGTSVLALFCKQMGHDPGGAWFDMVDAGLEHERVVQINDALRREARETGDTQEGLRRYSEEIRSFRMPVVKDPRFVHHPAVLRAWSAVRQDLSVLVTYRNPEHCLASHRRRARFVLERRNMKPDDIRCQMADCVENLLLLDLPFEIVLFPEFLGQRDRVCAQLELLGLELDRRRAEQVWAEIIDRDKVHIGGSAARSDGGTPYSGWIDGPVEIARAMQARVLRLGQRLHDAALRDRSGAGDPVK